MKIGYINTNDKKIAKDMFIKMAIKQGLHYVEMEDEVIIEYKYLFRFVEKEEDLNSLNFVDVLNEPYSFKDFTLDTEVPSLNIKSNFPRLDKNDYKIESKKVKSKVKTKINYNRRKY